VKYLLNSGANPNDHDKTYVMQSSLIFASHEGHTDVVAILLDAGANIEYQNSQGETALITAAQEGKIKVARLLLLHGANANQPNADEKTALSLASSLLSGDAKTEMCNLLKTSIEQMLFDISASDDDNNAHEVEIILNKNPGINVNKLFKIFEKKPWTATPLYIASQNCNTDVVIVLLNHKDIDVNAKSVKGETPLYIASKYDCTDVIILLLEHGADPNIADKFGRTPLHAASSINSPDAVNILLNNAADVDVKENLLGKTPLFAALEKGHTYIADALLVAGADINTKNNNGKTPLFTACENGEKEIIDFLLSRGANLYDKDNDGRTCFDVANKEIASILKQWTTTLFIDVLQKNNAYGSLDLKNIEDFHQYQGGKKRGSRKTMRKKRGIRKSMKRKITRKKH
jgi:serine/threonine-protein phosphatase 6 regulatory ankyrin repeat subunit B